jgi:CBS domain-containing protein
MFLFDPDRGRRRRAFLRDQAVRWARESREAGEATSHDMQNRVQGLAASLRSWQGIEGPVSERVLVERIRSVLGLVTEHPGAIEVHAQDGEVTLRGPVLSDEVGDLLSAVQQIKGVTRVENQLEVRDEPGNIPALQGSRGKSGSAWRDRLMQSNWSPTARVMTALAAVLGLGLLLPRATYEARLVGFGGGRRKRLQDIMTRGVDAIRPDDSLQLAAEKMKHLDTGVIPVCEGGRLVGMVTDRDIVVRVVANKRDPRILSVREAMTTGVTYCFEDEDVERASELMAEQQVRRLPVVNRERELVGIVSLGDLAVSADRDMTAETLEQVSQPAAPRR